MNDKYPIVEVQTTRIVCLDAPSIADRSSAQEIHRDRLHLFAEVIDTIEISDRYWVRPLALARSNPESFQLEFLHDLRDAAQLILPIDLFRDALDTEVLPLISELFHPTKDSTRTANAQKVLYQFIADLYRSSSI